MGFTFDDEDKKGVASKLKDIAYLISKNPRNADRIYPFIGGEEVNERPDQSNTRFIINLSDLEESQARHLYPDLLRIIEEKVKPERQKNMSNMSSDQAKRAEKWWQFSRSAKDLQQALIGKTRTLVISLVTKHLSFTFLPTDRVFSHKLAVLPFNTFSAFAVLQSAPHEHWARFLSSTMKDDLNYSPSDCFETFPFPPAYETNPELESAGQAYYEYRATLMVQNNEGLTKTYNRFHDPEEGSEGILRLREQHAAMDAAVLRAYGWEDLIPRCGCEFILDYTDDEDSDGSDPSDLSDSTPVRKGRLKKKPWRYRWPDDVRDEVLARLLKLNAERAAEEARQGTAAAPASTAPKVAGKKLGRKTKAPPAVPSGAPTLPTGPRTPVPAFVHARELVTALLEQAGGALDEDTLVHAFSLATQPARLLESSDAGDKEVAARWAQRWNEACQPGHLLPAISHLGSQHLRVRRELSGFRIELLPGKGVPPSPDVRFDALLALRVARKADGLGKESRDLVRQAYSELNRIAS